jgi:hypothetical protein
MSQTLRDPAVGLSCEETPLYMPSSVAIADIPTCESCSLIFSSPVVGQKTISNRDGNDGLNVDESPLCELHYNTTKYALYDTVILKKGAHRFFKADDTFDMEMNLYFREIFDPKKQIAVAIPITIDDSKASPYFTEMAKQHVNSRSWSLEAIISSGVVIAYKGMDLRNRNFKNPESAEQCQSATSTLTWFIIQSAYISSDDANTIRNMDYASNVSPPKPPHPLTISRTRSVCSIVPTIEIKQGKKSEESNEKKGVYLTRALQCQRINPSTDVKNNAVYLNGASKTTLEDELSDTTATALAAAANAQATLNSSVAVSGVRPKQVEGWLSFIAGLLLGIFIFCCIVYAIMHFFFKGFVQSDMSKAIVSTIKTHQEQCAPYVTPIVLTGPAPPQP